MEVKTCVSAVPCGPMEDGPPDYFAAFASGQPKPGSGRTDPARQWPVSGGPVRDVRWGEHTVGRPGRGLLPAVSACGDRWLGPPADALCPWHAVQLQAAGVRVAGVLEGLCGAAGWAAVCGATLRHVQGGEHTLGARIIGQILPVPEDQWHLGPAGATVCAGHPVQLQASGVRVAIHVGGIM